MNIEQLKYFVYTAKYLNFTKAAEECHVVQTAVSKQIASLENSLGVKLFERDTRNVILTKAGEVFLKHAILLLDHYYSAVLDVRSVASSSQSYLNVAYWGIWEQLLFPDFLKQYRKIQPKVKISLSYHDIRNLVSSIVSKTADVSFVTPFSSVDDERISRLTLATCRIELGVNENHPLAAKHAVDIEEIERYNFVMVGSNDVSNPDFTSNVFLNDINYHPKSYIVASDIISTMLMVESDIGISFFPSAIAKYCPHVKFLRVNEIEKLHTYLQIIWLKDNNDPILHDFIDALKDFTSKDSGI